MLINDVENKDDIWNLIITELKELGIKYRKDKKNKLGQEKRNKKRIFNASLSLLELTDVVLINGGIVQIPKFVSDSCQRILEQVEIEGIFRKAGSSARQKEIKANLENGLQLGRNYHVIDIANVLKSFFRELPEPLLPIGFQEPLLRALLCGEQRINAILMVCLLLPQLTLNTLAFFMQFLNTVAMNIHTNKMSIQNLAIIFTPAIMPLPEFAEIRFKNHVKIVEILIDHAEKIGVLPEKVFKKVVSGVTPLKRINDDNKKKKKRRSGSLTRMFNGLKKIVGAIGSAENLDNSVENRQPTPCLTKSAKKRKNSDAYAFSAKKKKDLLKLCPENGGLLPNTPMCLKEVKKSRLSLGGRKNLKFITNTPSNTSMERRWSVVGSGWGRKKMQTEDVNKEISKPLSPVISMPCIINTNGIDHVEQISNIIEEQKLESEQSAKVDYIRIPKSEYEAIKERVTAIETRISQEFGNVNNSLLFSSLENDNNLSGPERVLSKFEKTIEETESINVSSIDKLAKRLSRDLKIRRSDSNKTIRSPSARKIGSLRRRSKENIRLSRNKTWHISDTKYEERGNGEFLSRKSFYPRSNLKRGRPNTVQTGLHQPYPFTRDDSFENENKSKIGTPVMQENWTAAELFFHDNNHSKNNSGLVELELSKRSSNLSENVETPSKVHQTQVEAPVSITIVNINEAKTPMLPPRSIPRKCSTTKTPASVGKTANMITNKFIVTPVQETQNGRASIARLRSQNAGMVLAKAKLFDELGYENDKTRINKNNPTNELRRRSNRYSNTNPRESDSNSISVKQVTIKLHKHKFTEVVEHQKTPRRKNLPRSPLCRRQKHNSPRNSKRAISIYVNEHERILKRSNTKSPMIKTTNNKEVIGIDSNSTKSTPKIKKHNNVNTVASGRVVKIPRVSTTINYNKAPPKVDYTSARNSPRLRYTNENNNF